jgi:hypothetical protein
MIITQRSEIKSIERGLDLDFLNMQYLNMQDMKYDRMNTSMRGAIIEGRLFSSYP